ncbi:hypothetical protein THMIRHAS_16510 [Thiosulfatimonas sediminis]|uniref:Uncharacterized protein n=1 Tax=Thiosulfatimonas sediminis TaxID=2675054 RepID=A0A6F8PW99_9GAMM|nr:hypothetical protein [Thiosulfatimonas sediminis]BBP46278.1 hypothetical protein THMIRHAS_16510 [Thiosulfatimonas sediminis]
MNDNDKVDDLLDAVAGLDLAEDNLVNRIEQQQQQQSELNNVSAGAKMDASLIALEAAKAAQEAATQSQEAAQASLKLSEKMREHTDELSNANFNWRQSIRNAAKELGDSKKLFGAMLIITLMLALASIALMGTAYYQLNNKQEQLKGEILDIIQTENALFKRDLSIKIDDLSAQIEASRFYVEKMANAQPKTETDTIVENHATPTTTSEKITAPAMDEHHADGAIHAPSETHNDTLLTEPETTTAQQFTHLENHTAKMNTQEIEIAIQNQLQPVYATLNQQITQLSQQQLQLSQALSKLTEKQFAKNAPQQEALTRLELNDKQSQQLADIRWLVSKHDTLLKSINEQLQTLKTPNTNPQKEQESQQRLESQFNQMQTQQKLIEEQLAKLQRNVELIMQKVDQEKPYSYKAK